ncbi:MAG: hypothetical protein IPK82_23335 [Polyangiaceae bacterium]|nr:hypothetical protein [Polyangiaceae bacterium]
MKPPQRLPSGSSRIQIRDPRNPNRRKSFTRPTDAEAIAAAEAWRRLRRDARDGLISTAELNQKLRLSERGTVLTVHEIWHTYISAFAEVRKRALKYHWKNHYAKHFGDLAAEELTAERFGKWEEWEAQKPAGRTGKDTSRSTIQTLFALMRAAYGKRVENGELQRVPWGKWKPTGQFGRPAEEREALRSVKEVALVLEAARVHDERLRSWGHYSDAQARIAVMLLNGDRQGEAGAKAWDDFKEKDGRRVLETKRQVRDGWKTDHPTWPRPLDVPKSRSAGENVCHPTLEKILLDLQKYQRARGIYRPDGPMFPARHGGWRESRTTVEPSLFRKLLTAAGLQHLGVDIERFVTHSARHTFGTLEALHSQDIKATADRIRHRDQEVTAMYMKRGGRSLPASAIPVFAVEMPNAIEIVANDDELPASADPPTVEDLTRAIADRAPSRTFFEREWQVWNECGQPPPRPPAVTEAAERARTAAYQKVRRAGGTTDAAKRAGRTARRAYLGAWGKFKVEKEARPLKKAAPRFLVDNATKAAGDE